MVNRVILVGNLTRHAERITTQGTRHEASEFHTVSFGRLAEVAEVHCHKGVRVYLEGRLRTRDYTAADGVRRSSTEVVAETITLLSPRGGDDGGSTPSGSDEAELDVVPTEVVDKEKSPSSRFGTV